MLRFLFTALFTFVFFTSYLFAEPVQYEHRNVEKIQLTVQHLAPGTSFDDRVVLSKMKTKEGSLFSQEDFDNDLKLLSKEYDKIEPSLEVVDNHLTIQLKIWPKPTIRSIKWKGNENIKATKLHKELGIKVNTIFERQEFNTAFHKLKAYYIKKGYFEARLSYKVNPDPDSSNVDIDILIEEGRSGRIKEIIFVNFTEDEERLILDTLLTKKYNIFTSWLNNEGTYREEMMQQDELVIIDFLQNQGYPDARVDIQVKEANSSNRINVEITAQKGERYHFGKICFKGNTIFSNEEICQSLIIQEGAIFSPKRIRDTVQNIVNYYGARGYIDTYVTFEPSLHPEKAEYDVNFQIVEGGQFRVGMINIIGNNCTNNSVILHETRLIPGEIFNISKLKETELRLRCIGYFKNVNVYAVKSDEQCGFGSEFRDVIIEVEETSTGNLSAFMGFSTAESIFGGATITENNFNYKGLLNIFTDGYSALRGGGEYTHIKATIGKRQRSYELSWTKPYFLDTPWIVGFDVENSLNHVIANNYDIKSLGFTIRGKYPLNRFLWFGSHYRFRNTNVDVFNTSDPQLLLQAENSGLISAAGVSLTYDSTDSIDCPTFGFRSRLDTEFVGIGGDSTFIGVGYINTFYYPILRDGVFKFRADARYIFPFAGTTLLNMPLDERLYLGGETTVRGYRPYAIGPRFNTGNPKGGLSQLLFSAEYDLKLFSRLTGFAFIDAGDVSAHTLSVDTLRYSVGYGVRLCVFENGPPLVIGMGYPLNPQNENDVKRFFLSIGARF